MMPFRYVPRRLTDEQAAAIRQALEGGVRARLLARSYGVSLKTIYRARHRAEEPVQSIRIGDWTGRFAITDEGPVQVEPWRPAPEVLD